MSRIYEAHAEMVNREKGLGRGRSFIFSAATDVEAARDARRASDRLAADGADGFDRLGAVKVYRVLPREVEADGYLAASTGFTAWEWKSDHDQGMPKGPGPEFAPPPGSIYTASIHFGAVGVRVDGGVHGILFSAATDEAAVCDARRWIANRQRAIPDWFGPVERLEVSRCEPAPVAADGTVPPHAGVPFLVEADEAAPAAPSF